MPQPRLPKREVSPSTSKRRQKMDVHANRTMRLSRDTTAFRLYPFMYGGVLPSLPLTPPRTSFSPYPIALMEIMTFLLCS